MTGLLPSARSSAAMRPTSSGVVGTSMPADMYAVNANAPNRSTWRHTTPFGLPVVPPVYSISVSSPDRSMRPAGSEASTTSWYHSAPSTSGVVSSTCSSTRTVGIDATASATCGPSEPWNTSTSAPALSQM